MKASVFLVLLLFSLLPAATVLAESKMYRLWIEGEVNDGLYGVIVILRDGAYTAFTYEKIGNGVITVCTDSFVRAASGLYSLNLNNMTYVECVEGRRDVIVDREPVVVSGNVQSYTVRIVGSVALDSYPLKIAFEEVRAVPAGPLDWINSLKKFFETIADTFNVLWLAIQRAGEAFAGIAEAVKGVGEWIGRPGEPDAVYYYNSYKLQFSAIASLYGTPVAREVLECKRPIKAGLHLIAANITGYKYAEKTLCELERMQPAGFIGTLQMVIVAAGGFAGIAGFIAKNFALINAAIFAILLISGIAESLKSRNIEGLAKAINRIYAILEFYWRAVKFVAELIWRLIQVIANTIEAVLPFF